jgi:hypothetical protein
MSKFLASVGNVAGVAGVLVCAVAGAARVLGQYDVGGLSMITLFIVGLGLMVSACLAKLHIIASRLPGG